MIVQRGIDHCLNGRRIQHESVDIARWSQLAVGGHWHIFTTASYYAICVVGGGLFCPFVSTVASVVAAASPVWVDAAGMGAETLHSLQNSKSGVVHDVGNGGYFHRVFDTGTLVESRWFCTDFDWMLCVNAS